MDGLSREEELEQALQVIFDMIDEEILIINPVADDEEVEEELDRLTAILYNDEE